VFIKKGVLGVFSFVDKLLNPFTCVMTSVGGVVGGCWNWWISGTMGNECSARCACRHSFVPLQRL